MTAQRTQLKWIVSAFAGVLALDQLTKILVRHNLEPGTPFRNDVFFRLVHYQNRGMVGGIFSDVPMVAFIAPLFALAVLIFLFRHLHRDSKWQAVAYGLIVGGALGNIIDRVLFRAVTDFLQFHFYFIPINFPWKIFPAFNVADAAIDIGVVLLILSWNVSAKEDVSSTT